MYNTIQLLLPCYLCSLILSSNDPLKDVILQKVFIIETIRVKFITKVTLIRATPQLLYS